jgi:hypothetical protein
MAQQPRRQPSSFPMNLCSRKQKKRITDRTCTTDYSCNGGAILKRLLWLSAGSYCHILTTMWTSDLLVYVATCTVQIQIKTCVRYVHDSNFQIRPRMKCVWKTKSENKEQMKLICSDRLWTYCELQRCGEVLPRPQSRLCLPELSTK